jgi:hypothetical protein
LIGVFIADPLLLSIPKSSYCFKYLSYLACDVSHTSNSSSLTEKGLKVVIASIG